MENRLLNRNTLSNAFTDRRCSSIMGRDLRQDAKVGPALRIRARTNTQGLVRVRTPAFRWRSGPTPAMESPDSDS